MKRLQFSIVIKAAREHVWETMLAPETYGQWTAGFCEGSSYEGRWEEGAMVRFLSPSGEGMVAQIEEVRLHEYLSIRHLSFLEKGVEKPVPEPTFENYTFRDHAEGTELSIEMDSTAEYEAMFTEMWPRSLQLLKGLCEKR